jgi:hypothetical protein
MLYIIIAVLPLLVASYAISDVVRTRLWRAGNRYYDLFSILSFIVSFVLFVVILFAVFVWGVFPLFDRE